MICALGPLGFYFFGSRAKGSGFKAGALRRSELRTGAFGLSSGN